MKQLEGRRRSASARGRRRGVLAADGGFSSLEVLVVFGLFAVVATGLTVVSVGAMKANGTSRDAAAAATLLYDQVEKLRALDPAANPADLTAGSHQDALNPLTPLAQAGGRFTRSWQVTAATPRVGLAEVVIRVAWNDSTPRAISAVTYVCTSATCS